MGLIQLQIEQVGETGERSVLEFASKEIPVRNEGGKVGHGCHGGWQCTRQLVGRYPKRFEDSEATDFGRDGPLEQVVGQEEILKFGQSQHSVWEGGTGQLIHFQIQHTQGRHIGETGRDGGGQLVVVKGDPLHVVKRRNFVRDGPDQIVFG